VSTEQWIEAQASQIEAVLVQEGLADARVTGGRVAPHFVWYEVQTDQPAAIGGLGDEIALALHVPVCRIDHRDGNAYVEVPRADAPTLRLVDLYQRLATKGARGRKTIPPVTAVLGLDLEGVPLLVQLPRVGPLLVAGETGAGKTSLARTIVASLAMHNPSRSLRLALVGEGLMPFADLPHLVMPMTAEPSTTILEVTAITAMRDAARHAEHHLVLVIDDLDRLQAREQAVLKTVLHHGLPARVHLLATVADLSAMRVNPSHFPVRLLGRGAEPVVEKPLRSTDAVALFGRGDFFVVAKGQVSRMQAAFIEPEEIQAFAMPASPVQTLATTPDQAGRAPLRLIRRG
jgi:DNA segregation ATPase FtsK/SpoIIIE, S-DNA-T family